MTKLEITTEISRRLAEVSGRVYWTDDDIEVAANLGYAELSDATEWYEVFHTFDLLADRPYYDLRTILGEDFLALRQAFDPQTNRWLLPATPSEFDAHDRRWERVTGEPQRFITRGLWWLGLFPRLQSDVGVIKQYYVALPPPLADDDDEPGFPEAFHPGIVEFALSDLWAQDGEPTLATAAWTRYLAFETGLGAWVDGRAGDPLRHGLSVPPGSLG